MRDYFSVGANITWKQYAAKGVAIGVVRTGVIWSDAPKFDGCPGAHVWVIPDEKHRGENNAIAVRVFRVGAQRGTAEVYEDSIAYRDYSLHSVSAL